MMTEKQEDKRAREIESDVQRKLEKFDGAPIHERAMAEQEVARDFLKDCEPMKIPDGATKVSPSSQSDVPVDQAERIHEENKSRFARIFSEKEKQYPEHAQRGRESRGGRKLWTGISFQKA